MRHSKKILALLLSSLALTACFEPKTPTSDSADPGTGQVFPETGYTKIGNDGIILEDQTQAWADDGTEAEGTQWSCVRDNDTGLYWEVKTNDGGLRGTDWTYTWYDTNPATNGGYEGYEGNEDDDSTCDDNSASSFLCNTKNYEEAVNNIQLCGFDDWRLPTGDFDQDGVASAQELQSLLTCTYPDCDSANAPPIDTDYFPNTRAYYYWSSSPVASDNYYAWIVSFSNDYVDYNIKLSTSTARLVRSSQSL